MISISDRLTLVELTNPEKSAKLKNPSSSRSNKWNYFFNKSLSIVKQENNFFNGENELDNEYAVEVFELELL